MYHAIAPWRPRYHARYTTVLILAGLSMCVGARVSAAVQGDGRIDAGQRVLLQEPTEPAAVAYLPYLARNMGHGAALQPIAHWGGPARAAALDGDYTWMGVGAEVLAVDFYDPALPVVIGSTGPLPGLVADMTIDRSARRLYVALQAGPPPLVLGGLMTLDIGDPSRPRVIDLFELPDAMSVAKDGNTLVVATANTRMPGAPHSQPALNVFIGSHGHPPALISTWSVSDAQGLAVAGGHAYTCDPDAGVLAIVDLRDPARPRDVGLILDMACTALAFSDDLLFTLTAPERDDPPTLVVLDVSEPSRPRRGEPLELMGPPWGEEPWVGSAGDVTATALAVDDTVVWIAGADRSGAWLRTADVSDPAVPAAMAASWREELILDLEVADIRMAVAGALGDVDGAWLAEIEALDPYDVDVLPTAGRVTIHALPRPGRAVRLGGHDTPSAWILELAMGPDTGLAYLLEAWRWSEAGQPRLWIADVVAVPPRIIGVTVDLPWAVLDAVDHDRWQVDMSALPGLPIVTVAGQTTVIDARDPRAAVLAARMDAGANALASSGATFFTAGAGSLAAWSLDARGAPVALGSPIVIPDHPWTRVAAGAQRLWVSTAASEVALFDTTALGAASEIGRYKLAADGLVLSASGARAAALGAETLWLLNPTSPGVLAEVELAAPVAPAAALAIDGRHIWWPLVGGGLAGVALDDSGLPGRLVRTARPPADTLLDPLDRIGDGTFISPYHATRVGTTGGRVVLTRYGAGTVLYDVVEQ